MPLLSPSVRLVLGLLAGLVVGIAIGPPAPESTQAAVADGFALVGELWLNALRMTVLPLVVALLVTGTTAAHDTAASGRLAGRALGLFALLAAAGGILSAFVTPAILRLWPVGPASRAALLAGVAADPAAVGEQVPLREWFAGIIPSNPFAAAANGAILPLVVFTLAFALAASRLEVARRAPLVAFFQAVVDALLVLVGWVLWIGPLGVFALALAVGMRGGLAAAGGLGRYLVITCGMAILVTLAMYPLAVWRGRLSLRRFASALAPAQAVAFGTQSSLASLPAMLTATRAGLGVPSRVAGVVLPLAVAVFKATSPAVNLGVVIFVAHVTGIPLDGWRLALGIAVALVTSFGVAGIPGQVSFFATTVPMSAVMGVPMELLPLLLAVEVIPDLFRTVGNVTGDVTVATLLAGEPEPTPALVPAADPGAA